MCEGGEGAMETLKTAHCIPFWGKFPTRPIVCFYNVDPYLSTMHGPLGEDDRGELVREA